MSVPYVSEIPRSAEERITERYESGAKREAKYLGDGAVVGVRLFHPDGRLELELPCRDGVRHGTEFQWDDFGQLRSAIPYVDGLEHGVARQWSPTGVLLGTYEMHHGTGIDLWRGQRQDGSAYLAEARSVVSGYRHGGEWLINEDQASVHRETRFAGGLEHGIRREWGSDGALRTGYPRFYLLDRETDLEEYEHGMSHDPNLPAYAETDNLPARQFPAVIAAHLAPPPERNRVG